MVPVLGKSVFPRCERELSASVSTDTCTNSQTDTHVHQQFPADMVVVEISVQDRCSVSFSVYVSSVVNLHVGSNILVLGK